MSTIYSGISRVQTLNSPSISSHHPPLYEQPLTRSLQVRQLQQSSSKTHVNPSILVIVIILSVVFTCSGILHILARCWGRRRARARAGRIDFNNFSMQHLFALHDTGVDQVIMDTFPVFLYGSIRGLKDSADCTVCLNEFTNEDKLRLLPKCKHAFHLECIDTWLLSHSTCPLCRTSLLPDDELIVPVLESNREGGSCAGSLSNDEHGGSHSQRHSSFRGSFRASLRGSFRFLADVISPPSPASTPGSEIVAIEQNNPPETEIQIAPITPGPTVSVTEADGSEKILTLELGKVKIDRRRITRDVGIARNPRSYSMGSYEHTVNISNLGSAKQPTPGVDLVQDGPPSKPTHRSALSDSIPELARASQTSGNEEMLPFGRAEGRHS